MIRFVSKGFGGSNIVDYSTYDDDVMQGIGQVFCTILPNFEHESSSVFVPKN